VRGDIISPCLRTGLRGEDYMRFLITWTTYGHWLPGDPRGFRTRGAKEFVPPPQRYTNGESYEPDKYKLSNYGLKGRVWARKYHAKRISDEYIDEVHRYVRSHKDQNAVVIEFRR